MGKNKHKNRGKQKRKDRSKSGRQKPSVYERMPKELRPRKGNNKDMPIDDEIMAPTRSSFSTKRREGESKEAYTERMVQEATRAAGKSGAYPKTPNSKPVSLDDLAGANMENEGGSPAKGQETKPEVKTAAPKVTLTKLNQSKATRFKSKDRDEFKTTLKSMKKIPIPTIYLTRRCYETMFMLVDEVSTEVSWLGIVQRVGDDYLIDEIFVPEQKVSGAYTQMEESGIEEVALEILEREGGDDMLSCLRFWGHSHVNMGVFPSGTDDQQMEEFCEDLVEQNADNKFFVRGIFNKKGDAKFDVWDIEAGFQIHDCPWAVFTPKESPERTALKERIKEKVSHFNDRSSSWSDRYDGTQYGYPSYPGAGGGSHTHKPSSRNKPTTTHSSKPVKPGTSKPTTLSALERMGVRMSTRT